MNNTNNLTTQGGNNTSAPPPLPPRPVMGTSEGGYGPSVNGYGPSVNGYGPSVNGYGPSVNSMYPYSTNYSHYPSYSNYGGIGYGGMVNRPIYGGGSSEFVRAAEDNSRQALQSVESVVQTLSSIAYMLESSLAAVHSSFRAVLGVADQFSRLKQFTIQLVSALSIIRIITKLYRRFLVFLRLKPANYAMAESAWVDAAVDGASAPKRSWYSTIFFMFLIGGPYLLSKLMSKLAESVQDSNKWATGETGHYLGVANYTFITTQQGELALEAGQKIRIAPKEKQPQVKGWLLASSLDGHNIGLVPYNYIQIKSLPQN